MPVYLALSCLQGRPAPTALQELLALEPDGIQLTPGNLIPPNFHAYVDGLGVPYLLHDGFDWDRRKRTVWGDDLQCHALPGASVHPPREDWGPPSWSWPTPSWLTNDPTRTYEIMYPPYRRTDRHAYKPKSATYGLSSGSKLRIAMDSGAYLAVDVSHVYIQHNCNAIDETTWRRLQHYERIREIHVSANAGILDSHQPLRPDSFGLAWAKERARADNLPLVLECYMHTLSLSDRQRQLAILRDP